VRTFGAALVLVWLALSAAACTDRQCPDDSFVVEENGTCADTARQLTLSATACRVSLANASGPTGLPSSGALGQDERPLREGDFILYSDQPSFRLCRASRVQYRLEIGCVDGTGAPVCDAILTEPAP
jgi:hypothetical protein